MDGGADDQPPFVAVQGLLFWAEQEFTLLDGILQLRGLDIYALARGPLNRFVPVLYALRVEGLEWASEEDRRRVLAIFEWPEETEKRELEESDRLARETMAKLGIDPSMLG